MRGFTLLELMTTLAIGSVLVGVAVGGYVQLRNNTVVKSAQEKVVAALNQARLKALSTRQTQQVAIDYAQDELVDVQGSSISFRGVNVEAMTVGSCEPASSPSQVITFTAKGNAVAAMIRFSSTESEQIKYIVVNAVSGGVFVYSQCTGSGDYS